MTTTPRILDLNNFEDFKIATLIGKISDYTPYIKHTQGVTSPDDAVYQRRRYLLQENIAIEQIAETATEDEQVYIINKHRARQYYESWLSSSGRVRRCLARAGYFPEILDGIDSGLSVDKIDFIVRSLDLKIKQVESQNPDLNVALVFTANHYEMVRNLPTVDPITFETVNYNDYKEFRSDMIKKAKR